MAFAALLTSFLLLTSQAVRAQIQEPIIADVEDEASCHNACTALVRELGDITHYGPTSELLGFVESYQSSFQRDVIPACVVRPPTAKAVSQTITILQSYPCPVAIKSGGHAPTAGMSNVAGGITIDMKLLNTIEFLGAKDWDGSVSEKKTWKDGWVGKGKEKWTGMVTRVGTGNRWNDVYEKLDRLNVSVIGGRAGSVGVGGFVLGGGISYLSPRYGWSVDTIRNYEIVLPNGTLSNINHRSHPTIFRALRGGGNNFGIVTRVDMETFAQGKLWGGYRVYLTDPREIKERRGKLGVSSPSPLTFDSLTHFHKLGASIAAGGLRIANYFGYNPSITDLFKAFEATVFKQGTDLDSHMFWSLSYMWQLDTYLMAGQLAHGKKEWPEVFSEFKALKKPLYKTSRLESMAGLAKEVEAMSVVGPRQFWLATTLRTTPESGKGNTSLHELLNLCADIFIQEFEKAKNVVGVLPSMTFQPIGMNEIRYMKKNGGNSLGINEEDGPLVILSLTIFYNSHPRRYDRDDSLVRKVADTIMYRWEMMAKGHGMWHPYKYINYVDGHVDVFEGYGKKQREFLRGVKKELLSGGVRWDVGGFKV